MKKLKPKKDNASFDTWMWGLLSDAFELAAEYGWTIPRLAAEARLCNSTVYKLLYKQTREPRARTLFKLARAVGMTMNIIQTHYIQKAS